MKTQWGSRTPIRIESVCRFLDMKFDWCTSWDPTGAKARAPVMCKQGLWEVDFKEWCRIEKEPYCSKTLFFQTWNTYFKHIYMTDLTRYRQCTLCKEANRLMKKAAKERNENMKKAIFLIKTIHLEHVRNLRRNVKAFQKIGELNRAFMILFGDRADSHKFAMPSWGRGILGRGKHQRMCACSQMPRR